MPQPTILLTTTIVRATNITTATLDDELVMMNPDSNAYYGLDDIGAEIWNQLAAPVTVQQLCDTLTNKFAVDAIVAQQDVLQFLHQLQQEKIILCVAPSITTD